MTISMTLIRLALCNKSVIRHAMIHLDYPSIEVDHSLYQGNGLEEKDHHEQVMQ